MNLYKSTNRFIKNYKFLISKLNRQPTLEELSDFDHLHYNGITSVDEAIIKTSINKKSLVLDIGSGIGGPARYLAKKTSAFIYAVELQKELNNIAVQLTNNYKLKKHIKHLQADILKYNFEKESFDAIVSWLALYHIPRRKKLLEKLNTVLKKRGFFYVEDFFLKSKLDKEDEYVLSKSFHANHLVEYELYIEELRSSGFQIIEVEDLSKEWIIFTKKRYFDYKKNISTYLKVHDNKTVNNVLKFYELAYNLLFKNKIGGIRYVCSKK